MNVKQEEVKSPKKKKKAMVDKRYCVSCGVYIVQWEQQHN